MENADLRDELAKQIAESMACLIRAELEMKNLEQENKRLREVLADLERVSGLPMERDDPARLKARAALEGK